MSILKALIGGLIGAVVASFALIYLRDGSMRGFEWFPLVTGLLTGLGTRIFAGSTGRSLATGAIAGVISLLAICFVSDEMIAVLTRGPVDYGPAPGMAERAAKSADAASSDENEGAETTEESAEPSLAQQQEAAARSALTDAAMIGDMPAVKRPSTVRDFLPYVFSGLGVLLAYQLGRGSSGGRSSQHTEVSHDQPEVDSTSATSSNEDVATEDQS